MLKDHRVLRRTSAIIKDASEDVINELLKLNPDIEGREEEFTSQIKSEITLHLIDNIKKQLDDEIINGIHFNVYTFKKKEENKVGADLLGLVEITIGDHKVTKAYLAQAKVGRSYVTESGEIHARCSDSLLQKQVKDMLKITSDAFVFIYTKDGIFTIPALEVNLSGSNSIDTQNFFYRSFGTFYEEFFKCFIGDHHIVPPYIEPKKLAELASKLEAGNSFLIRVTEVYRNNPF